MLLNQNFKMLPEDYLFADVQKRVAAYTNAFPGSDIISLGIGDVTQPLPGKIIDACKDAANEMSTRAGFHGYGPYDGYLFLKRAVCDYYKRRSVDVHEDEVFVTDGAKNGIGNILDLFDEKTQVVIPDPVYPAYVDANILAGHKITYLKGGVEDGFLPMPSNKLKIKNAIIYICSPNNPTGAAYTVGQLKEWVQFALKNDCVIFYDAAYEAYIDDSQNAEKEQSDCICHSIFEICGARDCAVEFCSLSKTAGFTGVRCGWTIIPMASPLNRMWLRRQAIKFNGTSYIVQRMAESALRGAYEDVKRSVAYYMSNAKLIRATFDLLDIKYTGGTNAPYVWFDCGIDSWEFFDYMLKKARIVCTPGVGFGKDSNGWIRLTSFNSLERTSEAMKRFEPFWKEFTEVRDTIFKPLR